MGDGADDLLAWRHPEVFGDGRRRPYRERPPKPREEPVFEVDEDGEGFTIDLAGD